MIGGTFSIIETKRLIVVQHLDDVAFVCREGCQSTRSYAEKINALVCWKIIIYAFVCRGLKWQEWRVTGSGGEFEGLRCWLDKTKKTEKTKFKTKMRRSESKFKADVPRDHMIESLKKKTKDPVNRNILRKINHKIAKDQTQQE